MSTELEALVRDDRLEEAAELAERLGDPARAAELWERACSYERAARAALAAGEPDRALGLAARSDARDLVEQAITALSVDRERAAQIARSLADAGQARVAARLGLAIDDPRGAALDFERAGDLLEAASAFERAGDARNAARCLEAELTRDAGSEIARLGLGRLLAAHGRLRAASRVLQQIPRDAVERREALPVLKRALEGLGLDGSAREVGHEMRALGVEEGPPAPAPSADGDDRERLFGRYEVVRRIATTPAARVYEAIDRVGGARVAVKVFAAAGIEQSGRDALLRFEREARALGQLRHPAIVPLIDWLPAGPAVVLAWMPGGSLADLLAHGPIAPARGVEIISAVLAALGEAHRRGILHRDIKPANVLFDGAGAAHLADFGTAHVSDSAATVTSGVIGTLAYMAPEQRAGAPADIQSDIYGAGALLWHALTGAPPGAALPFLSDDLAKPARAVARRLVAAAAERPADALEAREALAAVEWPRQVPPARPVERVARAPESQRGERLQPLGGARFRDTLLGREVLVLHADAPTLERVLPFARADQPALAAVLRHVPADGAVWIEAPRGKPLDRPLDEPELARLGEALEALHRAGGFHGRVDRRHVVLTGGRIVLCFPLEPLGRSAEDDRAALMALG